MRLFLSPIYDTQQNEMSCEEAKEALVAYFKALGRSLEVSDVLLQIIPIAYFRLSAICRVECCFSGISAVIFRVNFV
jgi:hypothetical protein